MWKNLEVHVPRSLSGVRLFSQQNIHLPDIAHIRRIPARTVLEHDKLRHPLRHILYGIIYHS
jgi:hypothetical protein